MPVSVTNSGGTIVVNNGADTTSIYKDKVTVRTVGNNVRIEWDSENYVEYPYTDFTAPTGASAVIVAAAIEAFLDAGITVTATIGGQFAEDSVAASGDTGLSILAVRNDAFAALTGTDGDYSWLSVDSAGRLGTRDNKAEDAAHTSGDIGSFVLGVATTDAAIATAFSAAGDYTPIGVDVAGRVGTRDNKIQDAGHANGDIGSFVLGVRDQAIPFTTSYTTTAGDYSPFNVDLEGRLGTRDNKAEDAAHVSGDIGSFILAIRNDTNATLAADGDYIPIVADAAGRIRNTTAYQYTVNDAYTASQIGALVLGVRGDAFTTTAASADGDYNFINTDGAGRVGTRDNKAEDAAHASGDIGSFMLAVRGDSFSDTFTSANGDYSPINVDSTGRVGTRDNKAEDAAHASGDIGSFILAVRNDANAELSGTDGDYTPINVDSAGRQIIVGDVADNAAQSNLKPLYGGGKAVDIASYSPAYTAADAAGLAVNKDNGGLLVHQANLSSVDDSVSAIPGETTKTTYSCSFTALVGATAATDVVEIIGSATKTVRVKRIKISGTATAAAAIDVLFIKRSTAATGGTSTSATVVPMDSNNAAGTAVVKGYTANPTTGSAVGTIESHKPTLTTAAGAIPNVPLVIEFGDNGNQNVILRGAAQTLCINLNGATITGNSLNVTVLFTEE